MHCFYYCFHGPVHSARPKAPGEGPIFARPLLHACLIDTPHPNASWGFRVALHRSGLLGEVGISAAIPSQSITLTAEKTHGKEIYPGQREVISRQIQLRQPPRATVQKIPLLKSSTTLHSSRGGKFRAP